MLDETYPSDELEKVPSTDTGFAVGSGELRVGMAAFELELTLTETVAVKEAVRHHPETSAVLAQGFTGTVFRGDYEALSQIVTALKWFERNKAPMGQDKAAYDARTTFNHAKTAISDRVDEPKFLEQSDGAEVVK